MIESWGSWDEECRVFGTETRFRAVFKLVLGDLVMLIFGFNDLGVQSSKHGE